MVRTKEMKHFIRQSNFERIINFMLKINFQKNIYQKNQGQVMLTLVVLFMILSLIIIFGVLAPTMRNIKVVNDLFRSKQSFYLADSGQADAVYRVKNNMTIANQASLVLDGTVVTITIMDTLDGKIITTVSDYLDYTRAVQTELIKGVGASFYYGVQVGNGGFKMDNNSTVNGNVYVNGPITGGKVTGSAISATTTTVGINDVKVGTAGVGDAWAYHITNSVVAGALKCQLGSSNGTGRECDTSFGVPPALAMPISAEQITDWKAEAEAAAVINGNYSPDDDELLGPVKITGNLDIKNDVIMTGTIWVAGELSFGGQGTITLATSTYGAKSGVIIVDQPATFTGGSKIMSTGVEGSYVMLLVTSSGTGDAIKASGNAGSVVLAAPYGTISFVGNSSARGVVADKIEMSGGTTIDYEFGLADLNFVSGPAGGWNVQTYKEME